MIAGGLLSRYYLDDGIRQDPAWSALPDSTVTTFAQSAAAHLAQVPPSGQMREAETETLIIFKILDAMGWHHLPQQQGTRRREDIPDALLFTNSAMRRAALAAPIGMDRWKRAALVLENKAWALPLDRASGATRTPANQAQRYLRLADEHTAGTLRWALLTNGKIWRLYYAGAPSVADRFIEADLPALLADTTDEGIARQKTFFLLFSQTAFAATADGRSFLLHALEEGRKWQQQVTDTLSRAIFTTVYPALLRALAAADPAPRPSDSAWPDTIRHAAVVLLYRLLFLLYAEDRDLLPVAHPGYRTRSLRYLRTDIAAATDENRPVSPTDAFWWSTLLTLFRAVDRGSDAMGLPAYNGGLFDPRDAPLLHAIELSDAAVAPILDGLSRITESGERRLVNYRDLSVQQLGAIYERLLDFDVALDPSGLVTLSEDSFARKLSGSFYTPTSLVNFILESTLTPHIVQRRDVFKSRAIELRADRQPAAAKIETLRRTDPAAALLDLKFADPAMGSGHFLVSVVDRLADAVLIAMEEAAIIAQEDGKLVGYMSPLAERIATERAKIESAATSHGWPYRPEHLDDRHIVRRLVLKRAVYGVDRNPLAVELSKLSLWLHSFTVGAPLSFLDHHLRCGDSLLGAWVSDVEAMATGAGRRARSGGLTLHTAVGAAKGTAAAMAEIEALADADIEQVRESFRIFETVEEATAPLKSFLDCLHARLFLPPPPGATKIAIKQAEQDRQGVINAWLDGGYGDPVDLAAGAPPKGIPRTAKQMALLLENLRAIAARQKFLHWQPAFPGVWTEWTGADATGGFDAVIGNPPWVRQESFGPIKAALKLRFSTYEGKADLSVFFIEQAIRLARPGGRIGFVLPNKFFKADYGENLRAFLGEKSWIERVIDFGHNRELLPDADVFPCVLVARRPSPTVEPPENADVAVLAGEKVDQDRLAVTVGEIQYPMPLRSFDHSGWVIEPPAIRALMERIRRDHPSLVDYTAERPYRGVLTGLNKAFVIDTATRDRLVAQDAACARLLHPFLRGQDIERWSSDWSDQWMIFLSHGTDLDQFPSIRAHLAPFRTSLEPKPSDWSGGEWHGRKAGTYKWWEIQDSVGYAPVFDRPKVIYQEIQFRPAYSFDPDGRYLNNTGIMIATADPFFLASINSPLVWWFSWRHFAHGKDEVLRPQGFKMETLPIARPTAEQSDRAATLTAELATIHRARHQASRALTDWLRLEHGLSNPPAALKSPFTLSTAAFAETLHRALPKSRKLSVAAVAAIHQAHTDTIAPIAHRLAHAAELEKTLSALVNAAYRITPEEEALIWRTAPPRMPIPPPSAYTAPHSNA